MTPANCTCSPVGVGDGEVLGYNWSPDCLEHGVESEGYKSPEQVAKRTAFERRVLVLQMKASAARELRVLHRVSCSTGDVLQEVGECLVCDLAREKLERLEAQYDALSFAIRILADDDDPSCNRDSQTLRRLQEKLRPES